METQNEHFCNSHFPENLMAKKSQGMASLKQQLLRTESQLMAVRQKLRDKKQLLLYTQSESPHLTEAIFYRQTVLSRMFCTIQSWWQNCL